MAKVRLLAPDDAGVPAFAEIARIRDGEVPNFFRALGHSPDLPLALLSLSRVLWHESALPRQLQELVILRVAQLRACDYEWGRHLRIARSLGVPEDQLQGLGRWPDAAVFDQRERAALAIADQIARDGNARGDAVQQFLDIAPERQLVELIALASCYVMVATLLITLAVELEEGDERIPDVGDERITEERDERIA